MLPPWGECGSAPLLYFDTYDMGRCRRDCQINMTLAKCDCVAPYMDVAYGIFNNHFINLNIWHKCINYNYIKLISLYLQVFYPNNDTICFIVLFISKLLINYLLIISDNTNLLQIKTLYCGTPANFYVWIVSNETLYRTAFQNSACSVLLSYSVY